MRSSYSQGRTSLFACGTGRKPGNHDDAGVEETRNCETGIDHFAKKDGHLEKYYSQYCQQQS